MNTYLLVGFTAIGMLTLVTTCFVRMAQAQTTQTTPIIKQAQQTIQTVFETASHWQLEKEEWVRYQTLIQGPLHRWYQQLDPIEVLGIEAQDPSKRARYADLVVKITHDRVEKELAFQRAIDQAWQKRYPDLKPIKDVERHDNEQPPFKKIVIRPGGHIIFKTRVYSNPKMRLK